MSNACANWLQRGVIFLNVSLYADIDYPYGEITKATCVLKLSFKIPPKSHIYAFILILMSVYLFL